MISTYMEIQFLILMILGILCVIFLFSLIAYQIFQLEKNKQRIMSIFALLQPSDVKKVYDICDAFLDRFDSGQESTFYMN